MTDPSPLQHKLYAQPQPIIIDLEALRHERTADILARDTGTITNLAEEFDELMEFSVLSSFARRK